MRILLGAWPVTDLLRTPLYDLHRSLGARIVPFAGYEMPVQYPAGILAEHRHTRAAASLFDVSHMGQVRISGPDAIAAIERLVPGDIAALATGQVRYTMFTNERGGILDDLMVQRRAADLILVVNAANKHADIAHMDEHLVGHRVEYLRHRALLALQGPKAAAVLARHAPGVESMPFMSALAVDIDRFLACIITRSGYTGEDGFEISCEDKDAAALATRLLDEPEVEAAGLGARDSLRLEAGLCLHGHDITAQTTPIEAGLAWTISKRRRAEGGFPGADVILGQLRDGPPRRRVGLRLDGRQPAREGAEVVGPDGAVVGVLTSGGVGPSLDVPIAMAYVPPALGKAGQALAVRVRGKDLPAQVVAMPFAPHRYFRG
ncbi:glycine cleavage system aminomethyltransferase GcvT [Zavarzinia sp. CC-PAN008]|uniref:glycine cleavage system aminomethyltransferase GcvT n=1 Tax=Zavarzinia sp. CC-PAN008 TaxID=3243332 RepID=UPI003F7435C7